MHFANPLPWWLVGLVATAIVAFSYLSYRRPLVPLSPVRRAVLMLLRALSLGTAVFVLCRPTVLRPPEPTGDVVVPVLVDVSRSMRIQDAEGRSRLDAAVELVRSRLVPQLSASFAIEILAVGDVLTPTTLDRLSADSRSTDLAGAVRAVRERYRGRPVAGAILVSDGGDTGQLAETFEAGGVPVFTVGVGSTEGLRDREIVNIAAGDPRIDQASVDLRVSAVAHGYGRTPFELRLLANGRLVESRTVTPVADGAPLDEIFTVFPDPLNPSIYTAEIVVDDSEVVSENNTRTVLVSPPGRRRRVLALEGAPGYDHSFLARALSTDPGLDVALVVRKGRNDEGDDTFYIQAEGTRSAQLASGFPATREDLYAYDVLVVANVEGDFFTRAQLEQVAGFVSVRGGGLLVFGGRSFGRRGLIGTPLEDVLPLELTDRRGGLSRAAYDSEDLVGHNEVRLTPEGAIHPVMRLDPDPDGNRRRWSSLPTLAAVAPLGGPKPGATVLAVTASENGSVYPLVAVQRYGRGRSLVFTGEASWRWRMLSPATDRSYEFFWRQALRWLATPVPDQLTITLPDQPGAGDALALDVDVRDGEFQLAPGATVDASITAPGADPEPIDLRDHAATPGRFSGVFQASVAGAYRMSVEARLGETTLGRADRWFYVGGTDREFADPRLNEAFLRRIAMATGGRYVRSDGIPEIRSWMQSTTSQDGVLERRDLWHDPRVLALLITLLCGEWIFRRRWGLR